MTWQSRLDSFIEGVSPAWGARRAFYRDSISSIGSVGRGEWATAGYSDKKKGWSAGKPVGVYGQLDREKLMDASLLAVCENPLAKGIVDAKVTYVVGNGFRLQPMVDAEALGWERERADEWNAVVLREWRSHFGYTACDFEGQCGFGDLTALAYKVMLETGDAFALFHRMEDPASLYDLKLQVFGGSRVASPQSVKNVDDGVALTDAGRVRGYYVSAKATADLNSEYRFISAMDADNNLQLAHLFHKDYADQKRGLPDLAPVLERLERLDKYTDAYEKSVLMSSLFMAVVKTPDTKNFRLPRAPDAPASASGGKSMEMKPAMVMKMNPGEEIDWSDPPNPQSRYSDYWDAKAKEIGVGVRLPFELMTKKFGGSYSASKAAYTDAEKYFGAEQRFLIDRFCRPVYKAWLMEAIAKGRVDAPDFYEDPVKMNAYLESDWITGGKTILDEVRSATAMATRLDLGVTSLQDECQHYNGKDAKHVLAQRANELAQMEELGLPKPSYLSGGAVSMPNPDPEPAPEPVDPDAGREPDGGEEEVNGGAAEEQ